MKTERHNSVFEILKAKGVSPRLRWEVKKFMDLDQRRRRDVSETLRKIADEVAIGTLKIEDVKERIGILIDAWSET
jgi:hypothetical protein